MLKKKEKTINLLNSISRDINNTNLIKQTQYILISISGGQDSICIFFIFLQLKKQWKWSFGVIYCNHLWQKNTFFANLLVIRLVYMFKIPIYCTITPNKIFNENQSRHWRYDTFYRISFFYNYKIVSTGHTSSDKVETILFKLMRGTSTKSLTSLTFIKYFLSSNNFSKNGTTQTEHLYNYTLFQKTKTHKLFNQNYFFKTLIKKTDTIDIVSNRRLLVRPILNLHRFDLKKLLIFWELPVYPDISNKQTYYYRNRIRKQVLPTLRFFFNSQIDIIMLQFTEILITEQIYLDSVTNRLKHEFQIKNKKIVQLNSSLFYGIPLGIQRKLVKNFLESYSQKQAYFLQIEYILKGIISKKNFFFPFFPSEASEASEAKVFFEPKKVKYKSFSLVKLNFDEFNVYKSSWIRQKNQSKKKISLLNVYLLNRNVYTCFSYKNHLFSKYIHFCKKQFFLSSINKFFSKFCVCTQVTSPAFLIKKASAFFINKEQISSLSNWQLKTRTDFYIDLMIDFFIKKENKTSLQIFKSQIKKKNSFNFIKLVKKHTMKKNKAEFSKKKTPFSSLCVTKQRNDALLVAKQPCRQLATCKVACYQKGFSQLFCTRLARSKVSWKILNLFLHTYHFQKFDIFFYPEIGILFYFQKKLIILNN